MARPPTLMLAAAAALVVAVVMSVAAPACGTPVASGSPFATRCPPAQAVRTLPLRHTVTVAMHDRPRGRNVDGDVDGEGDGGEQQAHAMRLEVKGDVVLRSLAGGAHSEQPAGAPCSYAMRVVANAVARARGPGMPAAAHEDEELARAMPALEALHRWSRQAPEGVTFTLSAHGKAEDVKFTSPLPADQREAADVQEAAWAILAMLETNTAQIGRPATEAFSAVPELRRGHAAVAGTTYRLQTEHTGTVLPSGVTDFNRRRTFRVHQPEAASTVLLHRDTHTQVFKRTGHGKGAHPVDDTGVLYAQQLDVIRPAPPAAAEAASAAAAAQAPQLRFEIRSLTTLGDPSANPDTHKAYEGLQALAIGEDKAAAQAAAKRERQHVGNLEVRVEELRAAAAGQRYELRLSTDAGLTGTRLPAAAAGAPLARDEYTVMEEVYGGEVNLFLQAVPAGGTQQRGVLHGAATIKVPGKRPLEGCVALPLNAAAVPGQAASAGQQAASAGAAALTAQLCYTLIPRELEAEAVRQIEAADGLTVAKDKKVAPEAPPAPKAQPKPAAPPAAKGTPAAKQPAANAAATAPAAPTAAAPKTPAAAGQKPHVSADAFNSAMHHSKADPTKGGAGLAANPAVGKNSRFRALFGQRKEGEEEEKGNRKADGKKEAAAEEDDRLAVGGDAPQKKEAAAADATKKEAAADATATKKEAATDAQDAALKAKPFAAGPGALKQAFGTPALGGEVELAVGGDVVLNAEQQHVASVSFDFSLSGTYRGRRLSAVRFRAAPQWNVKQVMDGEPVHWHTSVTQPVRMQSAMRRAHELLGFPPAGQSPAPVKAQPPRGKCAAEPSLEVGDYSAVMENTPSATAGDCLMSYRASVLVWGSRWVADLSLRASPSARVGLDLCPDARSQVFFTAGVAASADLDLDLEVRPAHGLDWLDSPQSTHGPATCAVTAGPGHRLAASARVRLASVQVGAAYRAPLKQPGAGCLAVSPKGEALGTAVTLQAEAAVAKAVKSDYVAKVDQTAAQPITFAGAWTQPWCAANAARPAAAAAAKPAA